MSCSNLRNRGALGFGLLLCLGLVACGQEYPERGARYEGPIDPCDVQVRVGEAMDSELYSQRVSPEPSFWRQGPYEVWNTSPLDRCNDDPHIDEVGSQSDVAMYVTYPTPKVPTETGRGDVAPGRWPVVVFAHANNDSQCNIYRDYWSLHDHWASWGFIVAAVDGTYTNCRPGSYENIVERKQGQLAALDALGELDEDESSRFYGRIDLSRVVFAGHSRGGGSSLLAAEEHGDALGVIDIQGIDLTAFGFGSDGIDAFPVVGFTAGEDVDLNYPLVEPTEDQIDGVYTWVNIFGGIHAYTADDVPIEPDDEPFISRVKQHDITEHYSTAFLARHVGVGDGNMPPSHIISGPSANILYSHRGARDVHTHLSPLGVQQRWRSPAPATVIDDFDDDDQEMNLLGGANTSEGLQLSEDTWTYRPDKEQPRRMYQKARSRRLRADGAGEFRLKVDGSLTIASTDSLQARVKGPDSGDAAQFDIRIRFRNGREVTLSGQEHIGPERLLNRFTQLVVPGSKLGLDAETSVESISFEVRNGALFLDDLRLVKGESI